MLRSLFSNKKKPEPRDAGGAGLVHAPGADGGLHVEGSAPSDNDRRGGVGLVLAPGADGGLYVQGIAREGPAWAANCKFNAGQRYANNEGTQGVIRIGDCLLDVQEVRYDSQSRRIKGNKIDVFGMPSAKVANLLRGEPDSFVELTFRRVMPTTDPVLVTAEIQRGSRDQIAKPQDIQDARERKRREHITEGDIRFQEIDADNSGTVTLEELLKFLQENPMEGQTKSAWEMAHFLFSRADNDQSGQMDAKEFEGIFYLFQQLYLEQERRKLEESQRLTVEDEFALAIDELRTRMLSNIAKFEAKLYRRVLTIVQVLTLLV